MKNENICEFCGQVLLDGRKCNCPEAKKQQEIERQILNAKAAINEILCSHSLMKTSFLQVNKQLRL